MTYQRIYEVQIRAGGPWVKVRYDIFRSWSGQRRIDGAPYHGPVHTLGDGLPNPWGPADVTTIERKEQG